MKSLAMNPLNNSTLSASILIAIVLAAVLGVHSQQLQKGIHVDLAQTTSAQPMPAADESNAWIVTIANDGRLWFGTNPVSRTALLDSMISTPRLRDQNLYIKVDARARYADVASVLKEARTVKFDSPVLLTGQPESPQPGTILPPKGLTVWLSSTATSSPKLELEILGSSNGAATAKINGREIPPSSIQGSLGPMLASETDKAVVLRASGSLAFNQVAQVLDVLTQMKVKIVIDIPEV